MNWAQRNPPSAFAGFAALNLPARLFSAAWIERSELRAGGARCHSVPGFRGVYRQSGRRPDPVAQSGLQALRTILSPPARIAPVRVEAKSHPRITPRVT